MTSLQMKFHEITGRRVVEVVDDRGDVVGVIYPTQDGSNAVHLVSNYFADEPFQQTVGQIPVPGYLVKFRSP